MDRRWPRVAAALSPDARPRDGCVRAAAPNSRPVANRPTGPRPAAPADAEARIHTSCAVVAAPTLMLYSYKQWTYSMNTNSLEG